MTSAQLILVSVTSALVAVFAMLLVASIKRARSKDVVPKVIEEERKEEEAG